MNEKQDKAVENMLISQLLMGINKQILNKEIKNKVIKKLHKVVTTGTEIERN